MRRRLRPLALALALGSAAAAGCGAAGGRGGTGSRPEPEAALETDGQRAVVVAAALLRRGPGTGESLGRLRPDTVVVLGRSVGAWREVEVDGPLAARGWLPAEHLGCRALRELELVPARGGAAGVRLAPGALLAVLGRSGDRLEVETRDPVERRGEIAARDCGLGEPFVPTLPRDGALHLVARQTALLAPEVGGGPTATLPPGYRFVVHRLSGARYAEGRTDGPVVVVGRVDPAALEEDPRSTPLDRLAEPLGYSHENVDEAELRSSPGGAPVARLRGGTPLAVTARQGEWSRVRTVGPVELEGWLEALEIRRVSLDHNDLDPGARRRYHTPVRRDLPRTTEGESQPDDGP